MPSKSGLPSISPPTPRKQSWWRAKITGITLRSATVEPGKADKWEHFGEKVGKKKERHSPRTAAQKRVFPRWPVPLWRVRLYNYLDSTSLSDVRMGTTDVEAPSLRVSEWWVDGWMDGWMDWWKWRTCRDLIATSCTAEFILNERLTTTSSTTTTTLRAKLGHLSPFCSEDSKIRTISSAKGYNYSIYYKTQQETHCEKKGHWIFLDFFL